ncbi:MAG TPA: FAD-binding oxidoreductase [Balneolales bacterium]|nr:FAD-binding oxidoreductase [Balneolales bacterium]
MTTNPQMKEFRSMFRGPLLTKADEGYDEARKVYNGMIDKHPSIIAQCTDLADVITAVNYGRDSGLPVAIRGGGHSGPGLGSVDNGLVIDLRYMKGIRVDPKSNTAQVQGGCTWGDVDHATHPFGLAAPGGFVSTTGVAGLTLGGGIGYLSRSVGLTIDSLMSADMVLADGRFVTASRNENPDLFWAIRGGGGNFGVVTSFEFRLHPVKSVFGGPMLWPMDHARDIMKKWRDYILKAPEEISGWFGMMIVPPAPPFPEKFHNKKMCAIVWCDRGTGDKVKKRFTNIQKEFGKPSIDFTGPIPWPALQTLFDDLLSPGLQWYWKSDFIKDLDDEAIDLHVKHGEQIPTTLSTVHFYPINGVVQKLHNKDTAFSYRDADFVQMIGAIDPDPANNDRMIKWARDYWQELHPYSSGGAYINMTMDDDQEQVRAAYRDNYERLVTVKDKYDPLNIFRINLNVKPSKGKVPGFKKVK